MDMLSIISVLVIVLFILDFCLKPDLSIGFPKRIPIFGHLFTIGSNPHETFSKWSKMYSGIFSIHILHLKFVILNDYESIYEALVSKGNDFAGRFAFYRGVVLLNKKDIFLQDLNPNVKEMKLRWHKLIKHFGEDMKTIENIVTDITNDCINNILLNGIENVIDPFEDIYFSISNSLSCLLTGKKYEKNSPLIKTWKELDYLTTDCLNPLGSGIELDIIPWLRYLKGENYKKVLKTKNLIDKLYQLFKEEYEASDEKSRQNGLIFSLFQKTESSENDVKYMMFDIVFAGTATTTRTLYLAIMLLAAYPEIQEKIFKEIQSCLERKEKHNQKIELQDKENFPYTMAFLFELLRYHSIGPFTIPHKTLKETTIQNRTIPKDQTVLINLWNLHHNPKYWNKPWMFDPTRFLDDNGKLVSSSHVNRKHIMPFGAGPRVCLGQSLAMARLLIFITNFVHKLKLDAIPGMELKHDPRTFKFNILIGPDRFMIKATKRCN